jgi:hypothetical protein
MSRFLGNQLPDALVPLFDGERLDMKAGFAVLINTVDADGRPHPALLSAGEILAHGQEQLRLALYSSSSTTRNLRRAGGLSLAFAANDLAYYVKASASEIATDDPRLLGLAVFAATLSEVLEDGEAIARVTSGFTIELTPAGAGTVDGWREVIAGLRAIP